LDVFRTNKATIVFKALTTGKWHKGHPVCALYVGGTLGGFTRCCRCEGAHNSREQAIDCPEARKRAREIVGKDVDRMLDDYRKTDDKILREEMAAK